LNLVIDNAPLPGDVITFLQEADRRIERFRFDRHVPGFVPSDFARTYKVLRALAGGPFTTGNLFCEWGSGFGVVACLATMLDFDSSGIEIAAELVQEAQQLADDFEIPVEFIRGSFIPEGSKVHLDSGSGFSWLTTDGDCMPNESALGPEDFDVIFAYPWPDEEEVIPDLFERHANQGAILVTYHGEDHLRLRRKAPPKLRRQVKR
jgi:hypothetical protein